MVKTSIRMKLVLVFILCVLMVMCLPSFLQPKISYGLGSGVKEGAYQSSERAIDLYTQKEPYSGRGLNQPSDAFAPQEEVILYAYVTYNGCPVANKLVAFEVHGPINPLENVSFARTAETDKSGLANVSFRIPWPIENAETIVFGTWSVLANVEIAGERVDDTLTFEVGWIVEIVSIRTVDENLQPQTIFTKGTYVGIELLLRNIARVPKNVTSTFIAYDNLSRPINSSVILDFKVKPGVMHTYCVLGIPKWAAIGYATVFADAFTALPQLGGVRYCPEVSARFVITVRDVAVISVTPSVTEVYIDQVVNITVVAKNEGTATETFNVTAYYDETVIGTQNVTNLAPGTSTTLTFSWNTSGVPEGNYTIKAVASTVPGETEIVNNECVNGTITVKLPPVYIFPRELIILALIVTAAIVVNGVVILLYRRKRRKPSSSLSNFIKRFLTNLNAAGGVMSEETFLDLFTRTEIETKLNIDLIKVYDALRVLGVVEKVSNTGKAAWILTLKGLQFAGLSIDRCYLTSPASPVWSKYSIVS